MTQQTYLIAGATRGIGLELTKKFAEANSANVVIATARDLSNSKGLHALAEKLSNIKIIQLDFASEKSIDTIDKQLEALGIKGIDTFISNAAIFENKPSLFETDGENLRRHFEVNAVGPILIFKKVYKYLLEKETKKAIFISTLAASLSNYSIPTSSYGQSKAALNYAVLQFSFELKDKGFTIVALHPGAVATEGAKTAVIRMGLLDFFEANSISTDESTTGVVKVVQGLKPEDTGKFLDYKGEEIPW
ncbi:uncharacterized protein RJT21DRAFT_46414 [Scheffersomyces amazonensis]|uniref:uncharacterized protein n=1 Tax=Scheffersomyces amazonensis TaxID=1078765 RepID=UPI00315DF893